jgi:guanine deaminase
MGSSTALNLQKEIGNIEKNYFADLNVIDLSSTQEIDQRKSRANNIWEAIFPTLIMGDDRAIISTWVNGNEI